MELSLVGLSAVKVKLTKIEPISGPSFLMGGLKLLVDSLEAPCGEIPCTARTSVGHCAFHFPVSVGPPRRFHSRDTSYTCGFGVLAGCVFICQIFHPMS